MSNEAIIVDCENCDCEVDLNETTSCLECGATLCRDCVCRSCFGKDHDEEY